MAILLHLFHFLHIVAILYINQSSNVLYYIIASLQQIDATGITLSTEISIISTIRSGMAGNSPQGFFTWFHYHQALILFKFTELVSWHPSTQIIWREWRSFPNNMVTLALYTMRWQLWPTTFSYTYIRYLDLSGTGLFDTVNRATHELDVSLFMTLPDSTVAAADYKQVR